MSEAVKKALEALRVIAALENRCLVHFSEGPDYGQGYSAGSYNAFNQAASIVRSAIAALEAEGGESAAVLPDAEGWRDIASAPKDGKPILVFCPDSFGDVSLVNWWKDHGWVHLACHAGTLLATKPSHWFPLPAPPKEKADE